MRHIPHRPRAGIVLRGAMLAALPLAMVAMPASAQVPRLDMRATCHTKALDSIASETPALCMKDEMAARADLNRVWAKTPRAARDDCLGEVQIGGFPSYVELLTCVQMEAWAKELPDDEPGRRRRGAATTR